MWRLPISKDLTIEQTIELMAENNSQARSILLHCANYDPRLLLSLNDMNIRGAQILWAFAGYCEKKPAKFKGCVRLRNKEMVDYVNRCAAALKLINYPQKAVTRGGAPR